MMTFLRQHEAGRLRWTILLSLLVLGLLTPLSGCTRRFFRRRADADADLVLAQKDRYPGWWKLQDFYVYPHPLSRFADPTDPDRPPMPPDDPAAWDLSPHPQRPLLKGYKNWQGTGYLELMRKWDVENRTRRDAELKAKEEAEEDLGEEPLLPGENKTFAQRAAEVNDQIERELNSAVTGTAALPEAGQTSQYQKFKPFLLTMEQVTELGFFNSREFQTIREQLYLTALTVTAERFAFIAQPFVTEQVIRERSGAQSVDGQTNRWIANSTTGFTKLFSTGALLLLNFANQTVYNLGGGTGARPDQRLQRVAGHRSAVPGRRRPRRRPGTPDAGRTRSALRHPRFLPPSSGVLRLLRGRAVHRLHPRRRRRRGRHQPQHGTAGRTHHPGRRADPSLADGHQRGDGPGGHDGRPGAEPRRGRVRHPTGLSLGHPGARQPRQLLQEHSEPATVPPPVRGVPRRRSRQPGAERPDRAATAGQHRNRAGPARQLSRLARSAQTATRSAFDGANRVGPRPVAADD